MALIDDLVFYLKMDEASGNALDAHGSVDFTDNGTVGAGTGKINGGRDFEATNSEYFTNGSASVDVTNEDYTYAFWFKMESDTSGGLIAKPAADSLSDDANVTMFSGDIFWLVGDFVGSFQQIQWSSTLSVDTWYHCVVWHDSVNDLIGISINAGTPVTGVFAAGPVGNTEPLFIGNSGGVFFDGLIDEFGFWRRVLTSQERTDLYNGGDGFAYPFSTASVPMLSLLGVGA